MHTRSSVSTAVPFVAVPPPPAVMVSLRSYYGAPCRRLVSKGDAVLQGQPIGQPPDGGAWVHASVSGTVRAVNGSAVVIENDFRCTPVSDSAPVIAPEELHPRFLRHRLTRSGILTAEQRPLPLWKEAACQMLILSLLPKEPSEPEPMLLFPSDRVFGGFRLLKTLLQPRRFVIVTDRHHALSGALALAFGHGAEILTTDSRSPSSAFQRLTGHSFPPNRPLESSKILLFTPAGCAAVWEAAWLDQPMISRTILISGPGLCSPVAARVPLGTAAAHILSAVSGEETTLQLTDGTHNVIGKTDRQVLCACPTPADPDLDGSCPDSAP